MELQVIQNKIYEIRGERVMLDVDLAEMYGVETKRLKETVRRNSKRFPADFMFELHKKEWDNLRSQIATSSWGGARYQPFAFTEQGVAMLSGLLHSDIAIEVNISIMRAFVAIRKYLYPVPAKSIEERVKALEEADEELLKDVNDLSEDTRRQFDDIYIALSELSEKRREADKPRNPVGFRK